MVSLCSKQQLIKPSEFVEFGWCQGAAARDAYGVKVSYSDAFAVSWCLSGAIDAAISYGDGEIKPQLLRVWVFVCGAINPSGSNISVDRWNDAPHRTKADVLCLLRQAENLAGL